MTSLLVRAACLLLISAAAFSAELEAELKRLDAFASDTDGRLVLTATVAAQLGVHRNRIILLRKETGKSHSTIVVERLRANGDSDAEVLRQVRLINAEVGRKLSRTAAGTLAPVAYLTTTWDYSSAGSIYTAVPEIGVDGRRFSILASVPVHRLAGTQQSATGVGDAQISAILRHSGERFGAWSSVSLGLPTGSREQGLGAGKLTADGSGTLSWRVDRVRVFGTAGLTNSVFRDVGYQRPYITTGTAAHGSAGVEGALHRRFGVGAGGFFLEPRGPQTVINRIGSVARPMPGQSVENPGGMHGGIMPVMQLPTGSEVAANELSDRGPNAWAWFAVSEAVNLNVTVARSVPLELTTVRIGFGFDMVRLLRH